MSGLKRALAGNATLAARATARLPATSCEGAAPPNEGLGRESTACYRVVSNKAAGGSMRYTPGQVRQIVGITQETLRHWRSVFGSLSGEPPHNQKMFDALLYEDLQKIAGSGFFFMEGESKRIGHAVQPPELYEKKNNGIHIRVVSKLEKRVERIYEQYVEETEEFHARVEFALGRIMKRIKPDIQKELLHSLEARDYKEMIRLLIIHYYDPRYDNKINETLNTALEVDSDSIEEATKAIAAFIEERLFSQTVSP